MAEELLIERVAACFSDGRDPGQLIHALPTLIGQRISSFTLDFTARHYVAFPRRRER